MTLCFERIKELRLSRALSQEQLASMVGVSRSTIGMYETGKREPDLETCEAIADIFNVDMDYLIGRSNIERRDIICDIKNAPFEAIQDDVSQDEELIRRIRLLTREELAQVKAFIQGLLAARDAMLERDPAMERDFEQR